MWRCIYGVGLGCNLMQFIDGTRPTTNYIYSIGVALMQEPAVMAVDNPGQVHAALKEAFKHQQSPIGVSGDMLHAIKRVVDPCSNSCTLSKRKCMFIALDTSAAC
jgi:hypothetical protein